MSFDVVVNGASSSGLHAAALLARAGKHVAVFEKHENLERTRRTLIVTPELHRFVGDLPLDAIVHRAPLMAVSTTGAAARIRLKLPDLIIERSRFIQILAERACSAGAEILFKHRFVGSTPLGNRAVLHYLGAQGETREVETAALIGADGVNSSVARAAGLPLPPSVPIVQAEVDLPASWNPLVTQVWFDTDRTRFFFWLIPESESRGVVGVVSDTWSSAPRALSHFMNRAGLAPLAFQASSVAMHLPGLRPWGRLGAVPVYLIGDAAGQVKVTTVGGTVSGFWGAEAAARSIITGSPYGRELRGLKRELDLHWWLRWVLDRFDNAGYDMLVGGLGPFAQHFLSSHNRDAMAPIMWMLVVRQPQLVGIAFRLLMKRPPARPRAGPELLNEAE